MLQLQDCRAAQEPHQALIVMTQNPPCQLQQH